MGAEKINSKLQLVACKKTERLAEIVGPRSSVMLAPKVNTESPDKNIKSKVLSIPPFVYNKTKQYDKGCTGGELMDWQEKYIDKLDKDVGEIRNSINGMREEINQSLHATENRIAQLIDRNISEMRDRDNQRHQELLDVNSRIDNNISQLSNKINSTNKWIVGMAVSTILAVAGLVGTSVFAIIQIIAKSQ